MATPYAYSICSASGALYATCLNPPTACLRRYSYGIFLRLLCLIVELGCKVNDDKETYLQFFCVLSLLIMSNHEPAISIIWRVRDVFHYCV